MKVRTRARLVASFVVVAAFAPSLARAGDTAAADALFQDGKALRDAGRWEEACPKFEASLEVERTLGTLLSVGDCHEHTGRLARALAAWDEAIVLAREKNDPRVAYAQERKAAIEARVPSLVVSAKQGAERLTLQVGAKTLAEGQLGIPFHVDPGTVSIEVRRGEVVLEKQDVVVGEGATMKVDFDLAAIARKHPVKKKLVPPNPAHRNAGIVLMSAGLGGVVAFGVLEAIALGKRSQADGAGGCKDIDETSYCTPQGYELAAQAGDFAEVGQWVGVAGIGVLAIGVTVFFTAPREGKQEEPKPKAELAPWIGPGIFGLSVRGAL